MMTQLKKIYDLITELEAQTELPISEWNESEIYSKIYDLKKDIEKLNNIRSCSMSLMGVDNKTWDIIEDMAYKKMVERIADHNTIYHDIIEYKPGEKVNVSYILNYRIDDDV